MKHNKTLKILMILALVVVVILLYFIISSGRYEHIDLSVAGGG